MQKRLVLLDAPSNLGLKPPADGVVPGVYKMPWALREAGISKALGASDGGTVVPPRYESAWEPGKGDRNADAIRRYSQRLSERIGATIESGCFPVVLGGDCSILLGSMLALKRRGRYGLAFIDGHSDFRHPGNAAAIGAAAGEDLAIATGRGDRRLTDLADDGALVADRDVVVLGIRERDEYLAELRDLGIAVLTSTEIIAEGSTATAQSVLDHFEACRVDGFWVHLDWDVIDRSLMPAVDCPEPDGLDFDQLAALLRALLAAPQCAGIEITIYDPDLDEDGRIAADIVDCLRRAFDAAGAGLAPTRVSRFPSALG